MNDWMEAVRKAKEVKDKYPAGTRIELCYMSDPRAIQPGERGTVRIVDSMGTIHVVWDNGRMLGVIPGVDSFRVVDEEKA